ncbi:MAG TPA: type VI secretion system tube protein TssD [Solirubrobacteraceae bacterium]|jgi:type VI secretion system secreted protein Hcp|nr:type VI secretion system tube protein TssD [Solirubrobacteraceae bacterium]
MSAEEASRIARAVQRMRNAKRGLQIALPTAAALGAGAAIAAGAIPGSDGTITGCYAGTTASPFIDQYNEPPGALRVIDPSLPAKLPTGAPNPAAACQEGESTITWNQQGPTGPQGPQGAPGTPGSQGSAGEPGGETNFGLENNAGLTFLKLDGISGQATDKRHKGDIEVSSFSFGIHNTGAHGSGGGGGAGKTSFESFTIMKTVDKASPLLFQACATGKHIKWAELLFARKAGSKQEDYLYIKLQDVLISSVQAGGSSKGAAPQEQVSLTFQKMQETYLNGDGKPQATLNFNLSANAKI